MYWVRVRVRVTVRGSAAGSGAEGPATLQAASSSTRDWLPNGRVSPPTTTRKRGVPRPEPTVHCRGTGAERSPARCTAQGCLPTDRLPTGRLPARPGPRLSVLACRCLHLCLMISGQCLRRVRLALRYRGCQLISWVARA